MYIYIYILKYCCDLNFSLYSLSKSDLSHSIVVCVCIRPGSHSCDQF